MGATIPLRIDSQLVHQARTAGALHDRPPTAQIEHWAKLGRVLDPVLSGRSVTRMKQTARIEDLHSLVETSQTVEGRQRVLALIRRHGGPVYEADPENPDRVIERQPDGSTRRGRFVNRRFEPAKPRTRRSVAAR